jgi:hypothetical protein
MASAVDMRHATGTLHQHREDRTEVDVAEIGHARASRPHPSRRGSGGGYPSLSRHAVYPLR